MSDLNLYRLLAVVVAVWFMLLTDNYAGVLLLLTR
jgi:hypothetical protein